MEGEGRNGGIEGLAYLGERKSTGEDGGVIRSSHVVIEHLAFVLAPQMHKM